MNNESTDKKYNFPRIKRIQLHSFSLFSLRKNPQVEVKHGVTVLAGANGIGKSTFLATVNFGLTGAVPHPNRKLRSLQDYLKDAANYSRTYFDGRISETDRDDAAITIDFELAGTEYRITRALLDSEDVREFRKCDEPTSESALNGAQRNEIYKAVLTRSIGLSSFEQYVFLQHFIFTFDEARDLLFWNDEATSQALFLCFGGDPGDAARADFLSLEASKAGSRARNLQYQVNNTLKRFSIIASSMGDPSGPSQELDELKAVYDALTKAAERSSQDFESAEAKLSSSDIKIAKQSGAIASLRAGYSEVFGRFIDSSANVEKHPLVNLALTDHSCGVCRTHGDGITKVIAARLEASKCPFCESPLQPQGPSSEISKELALVDARLSDARQSLEEELQTRKRLADEVDIARKAVVAAKEALNAFESANQDATEKLKALQAVTQGPMAVTLEALKRTADEFTALRDAEYAQRDTYRNELKSLQKGLELRYAQAEEHFVPRFRKLAGLFLGIDLDVVLRLQQPSTVKLVLELKGSERYTQDQLSESQRFFVDIALRMSLAQQMSSEQGKAPLLVDTPEGSLDIAYEDRAGEMFAKFGKSGHDLLMTANINSSKLLTTLAHQCGSTWMSLNPMTGWSELSDVQQGATDLFDGAYSHIESALATLPDSAENV